MAGMKLSRQCEIAIDILVLCAKTPNRTVPTREAADFANAPKPFTSQIVLHLVRGGFLNSVRGPSGGIRLAGPAKDIVVGEVVRFMDATFLAAANQSSSTAFKLVLADIQDALLKTLDAFSIADLAEARPHMPRPCVSCEHRSFLRPIRVPELSHRSGSPVTS